MARVTVGSRVRWFDFEGAPLLHGRVTSIDTDTSGGTLCVVTDARGYVYAVWMCDLEAIDD